MPLMPGGDDKRPVAMAAGGPAPASIRRLSRDGMDQAALVHRTAFDERLPWRAGLIGFVAFRDGWVDQFYVLPAWQRRGVGAALLEIAKAAFPEPRLWTFQRNAPARRFYEKRGFTALEETEGHRNKEREPDILYRWQRPAC